MQHSLECCRGEHPDFVDSLDAYISSVVIVLSLHHCGMVKGVGRSIECRPGVMPQQELEFSEFWISIIRSEGGFHEQKAAA